MDVNTLFETAKDALSQNSALTTWANATYSQQHKVYANVDVRTPPGEDDCPYVAFYPATKIVGDSAARKNHAFEFICCINDDTLATNDETNVVEYAGVQRLETFRKLVEDAISGMSIGNVALDMITIEYDTIESFPFMLAAMSISFGEAQLIGVDPLE